MMRSVVSITLLALALASPSVAFAQDEQEPHHVFLPLISTHIADTASFSTPPLPDASLIVMSTPPQAGTCSQAAPELANGLQAWLVETDTQQIELALCTRLVLNSEPITGTTMSGIARHGTAGTWFTTFEADDAGIAAILFQRSQAGLDVTADISIDYAGGSYTVQTSFSTPDDSTSDNSADTPSTPVTLLRPRVCCVLTDDTPVQTLPGSGNVTAG